MSKSGKGDKTKRLSAYDAMKIDTKNMKLMSILQNKLLNLQLKGKSKKYKFYLQKEDPLKYNEAIDRNMSKDANDKHKNILLKISEMIYDMNIYDKWKSQYY